VRRTFDRVPSKPDPVRLTTYNLAPLITHKTPRGYTWRCGYWLDQQQEGACVPHAYVHEALAAPVVVDFTKVRMPTWATRAAKVEPRLRKSVAQAFTFDLYDYLRTIDEIPGENYEGTTMAAGARGMKQLGFYPSYRWSKDADDLSIWVSYRGPAVLGCEWFTGMMDTDTDGFIRPSGIVEGLHGVLLNGFSVRHRAHRIHQSWGLDWGVGGEAWLPHEDLKMLLANGGEAMIPMSRRT
jgi:hypothetical protein